MSDLSRSSAEPAGSGRSDLDQDAYVSSIGSELLEAHQGEMSDWVEYLNSVNWELFNSVGWGEPFSVASDDYYSDSDAQWSYLGGSSAQDLGPNEPAGPDTRPHNGSDTITVGGGVITPAGSVVSEVGQPQSLTGTDNLYTCLVCNKRLSNSRALQRHLRMHDPARYRCRCDRHFYRKYDYKRHLRTCRPEKRTMRTAYVCLCGREDTDFESHEAHFKDCGKGRAGRPRRSE